MPDTPKHYWDNGLNKARLVERDTGRIVAEAETIGNSTFTGGHGACGQYVTMDHAKRAILKKLGIGEVGDA